ncbi:DDE_3 domain-containing protein [Caerostris darwini]|uniref:DDE_3 domain-containing protein n=1 Tax=Caerostris darwini TaxID=1538125 RepID=A0AAV4PR66_9ARAC|nr:DDE_3 domain-containing protein [Caerostris darwini]
MDLTSKKRTRIVILSHHTSMTVRDITAAIGVGKFSISMIINQQNKFGTVSPKRNKCVAQIERDTAEHIREQDLNQTVKHSQKQRFGGYFTSSGPGSLIPVEGMMDSQDKTLPFMETFAGDNGVFQQDLASCHTSKLTTKYLQGKKLTILDSPGNSPDVKSHRKYVEHCKEACE